MDDVDDNEDYQNREVKITGKLQNTLVEHGGKIREIAIAG